MSNTSGNRSLYQGVTGSIHSFGTSTMSNWGVFLINFIIGFLLAPILIRHLGDKGYGTWNLVFAIGGYYGFLRLGMGAALIRYIPFYLGKRDYSAFDEIISTSLAIYGFAGILIISITIMFKKYIALFFRLGADFETLLIIIGIAFGLECITRMFDSAVRAREAFFEANIISCSVAILRGIGLFYCVKLNYGLIQMGFVQLAVTSLSAILCLLLFLRLFPDINFSYRYINKHQMRKLVSFGILALITSLARFRFHADKIIIAKILSLDSVTYYAIAVIIMSNYKEIITSMTRVFRPRFGFFDGENNYNESVTLFLQGSRINAIISSWITLLIIVLGSPLISIWIGKEYGSAWKILMILSLGYTVGHSQNICNSLLAGHGRQGILAIFAAFEITVGIFLGIYLAKRIGITGIAIGNAVPFLIIQGIIRPIYTCHFLRIKFSNYAVLNIMKSWGILGLLVIASQLLQLSDKVQNWLSLCVFSLLLTVVYFTICLFTYTDVLERSRIAIPMLHWLKKK